MLICVELLKCCYSSRLVKKLSKSWSRAISVSFLWISLPWLPELPRVDMNGLSELRTNILNPGTQMLVFTGVARDIYLNLKLCWANHIFFTWDTWSSNLCHSWRFWRLQVPQDCCTGLSQSEVLSIVINLINYVVMIIMMMIIMKMISHMMMIHQVVVQVFSNQRYCHCYWRQLGQPYMLMIPMVMLIVGPIGCRPNRGFHLHQV